MAGILVLQGPNLNLLGTREPHIYGSTTLADIEQRLQAQSAAAGFTLEQFQSNAEHELLNRIHAARTDGTAFIIINPAAFTHTSVALRDALAGIAIPFIEVHISNVHAREAFRQHSYLSDIAIGVIAGLGVQGYELALQAAVKHLQEQAYCRGCKCGFTAVPTRSKHWKLPYWPLALCPLPCRTMPTSPFWNRNWVPPRSGTTPRLSACLKPAVTATSYCRKLMQRFRPKAAVNCRAIKPNW